MCEVLVALEPLTVFQEDALGDQGQGCDGGVGTSLEGRGLRGSSKKFFHSNFLWALFLGGG